MRGDVVRMADGKPRPAVIVQADAYPTRVMILICPLTSTFADAPLYRLLVQPTVNNGLLRLSQLMVDRIGPVRQDRIEGKIGRLGAEDLQRLDVAMTLILDLDS